MTLWPRGQRQTLSKLTLQGQQFHCVGALVTKSEYMAGDQSKLKKTWRVRVGYRRVEWVGR